LADTPLWADAAGSLPLGIAPPAAIFEPLAASGRWWGTNVHRSARLRNDTWCIYGPAARAQ
jgi:hypothetical protein